LSARWLPAPWPPRHSCRPPAHKHRSRDHAFTKAMVRFEELVKKYYGKPINFNLHKNSSLGLEKQYFEYMAQGKNVDYAIVSPAHMSTFAKAAPFIDAPFVFRDFPHMEARW
jgi:TRAP-type C4-dicarboxylate transport system substrate-binding protein